MGAALVHVGLRHGDAVSLVKVKDLGGGWMVPVHMKFEKVLGSDWGPETVTLSDVRVLP
jgi:hypothetical protein